MRNAILLPALLSSVVTTVLSALLVGAPALAAPAVGDVAPDFTLHGTDGALYKLSDQVGKRGVVLDWFPKAFTPG